MEELLALFCFLIALAIALGLVTVIGHGIWVLVATIFSSPTKSRIDPDRRGRLRRAGASCAACGGLLLDLEKRCPVCGRNEMERVRAGELRDLEAAARTIQRLKEEGTLTPEVCEHIYRSIENRQQELVGRQSKPHAEPAGPIAQLKAWFGADRGAALTVDEKKQALALARTLPDERLPELTADALVGIARLQTAVGTLSRACRVYQVLLDHYPKTAQARGAAVEALRIACKAENWRRAEEFVRIVSNMPGLIDQQQLAALIEQVRERGKVREPAPVVVAAPAIEHTIPEPAAALPEAVPEPATPRRSFAEWIGVFMEERNILWGELIGGTLIIGCSIALVISLWHRLAEIQFFPFLLFAAITGALFGAGFYTLHRWKLESTSRGLLLIASLLVPLTFAVLAGLARAHGTGIWHFVFGTSVLTLFGWLFYRSAQILVEKPLAAPLPSALLLTLAILVAAAAQTLAPVLTAHEALRGSAEYALSLLPVLAMATALGWILLRLWNTAPWSIGRLSALVIALGCSTFACGIVLGFLLFDSVDKPAMLLHLSAALTLFGIPILLGGTMIQQKLGPAQATDSEQPGLWRTLGTALALAGLAIMFGGLAVALADPWHRWLSGLIAVAALLAIAWHLRLSVLHIPMQLCLGILSVAGTTFDVDINSLLASPSPGLRLMGVMALQAIGAEIWTRWNRPRDAHLFALGGAVSTALAILLVLPHALLEPEMAALVLGLTALIWGAANLRWRLAEITYASCVLLAGAIFFAFRAVDDSPALHQALWSLLTHATVCLLAAVGLRLTSLGSRSDYLRVPLEFASLGATIGVAGILLIESTRSSLPWGVSASACFWLAALWLLLSALLGWSVLFGAFQMALSFAWFFAAADRLTSLGWDWREPYCLHVYAVGVGVLCLASELTRIVAVQRPCAPALLLVAFVPVDRILSVGLLLGQFGLAALVVLWPVGRELVETNDGWRVLPPAWYDGAYSIWAWSLLGVLAAMMSIWLRRAHFGTALVGLAILLLTLPLLVAGACFDETQAAASALRWGLALCYALGSAALWYRHRLTTQSTPALALRLLLLIGAVAPALAITMIVVVRKLANLPIAGPVDGMFVALGGPASLLIPLALLSATLAGHGFRERLAYYLSAAGLLASASCVGAFFLALQLNGIDLGQAWVGAMALLIAAGAAWWWSILWTLVAGWLEESESRPLLDSALLTCNNILGALLFGSVLAPALALIVARDATLGRQWIESAGSLWAWLVFGAMSFGACCWFWKRRASIPLHLLAILSLTAVGVIACGIEIIQPEQGYLALMFGGGVFALGWVCTAMLLEAAPPRWLAFDRSESVLYASVAGVLTVLLGSVTFFDGTLPIWSAESIALIATASALLAYHRKTEFWASVATGLVMLASTILVVHFDAADPDLWLRVMQMNLGVIGATAVFRLGLHRWLAPVGIEPSHLVLLPVQIALGMMASLMLGFGALASLAFSPAEPGPLLTRTGDWAGWLALSTNVIAAVWYVGVCQRRWVVHALTLGGLMLGVALAGTMTAALPDVAWIGHHVLTLTWTMLALIVLIAAWASHAQVALGPQFWSAARRTHLADALRQCFPERPARAWVSACGLLVVLLALRAISVEPDRPYWSVANTLAVSVLLGALAIWARAPVYLYGAGFAFNIVGLLLFTAWSAHRLNARGPLLPNDVWISYGVLAQILSFAVAAIVASLLERMLHRRGIDLSGPLGLSFAQFALLAGIHLLALGVGVASGLHLIGADMRVGTAFAWIALGMLAVAAFADNWRSGFARFTRMHLYTCGFLALGILLHGLSLSIADWYWAATLLLAGYILVIVALFRLAPRHPVLGAFLGEPAQGRWFWHVQLGMIGLVLCLSLRITLNWDSWHRRLGGALACSLLMTAAFLMPTVWARIYPLSKATSAWVSRLPRYVAVGLTFVAALEIGWALIELDCNALWLQRDALAFTLSVAALLLGRVVVPRVLHDSEWMVAVRSASVFVGGASVFLLAVLLGQEFVSYDPHPDIRTTPLHLGLVASAALALAGLIGLSLSSALTKKNNDPYGIENAWRSTYIYLGQLFVLALIAHVRLNVPDLLPPILGRYWYLAVMALAFAWVGLGEVFGNKGLSVLATPLQRTAWLLAFVPVIAFRLGPVAAAGAFDPLRDLVPGLDPFLLYLKRLSAQNVFGLELLPMESLCWLLLGMFFGWQSRLRHSANLGIFAMLAVNFGVWVLLGRQDATAFLSRPQLWLIPLGLIVLVAEFVNRDRLGFWPSLAVRYMGLMCIYLSSTLEMFKEGLGNSVILPLVLALLAVAGALLGILFRVRAFLLAGFLALFVVMFAQIWHAAVDRGNTWLWWASGLLLGVLILGMFALFEKHRNGVLKAIDSMKRWH